MPRFHCTSANEVSCSSPVAISESQVSLMNTPREGKRCPHRFHPIARTHYPLAAARPWVGSIPPSCSKRPTRASASLKPGEEPPMHVHRYEDEWLYVLDG